MFGLMLLRVKCTVFFAAVAMQFTTGPGLEKQGRSKANVLYILKEKKKLG